MQILADLEALSIISRTESEEVFSGDKITIVDSPAMINVKVVDPGLIAMGKLLDQTRQTLHLRKLVDFRDEAFA
jgi:hypothetical protein